MSLLANVLNSNGQIDFCRSGLGFLDSLILPLKALNQEYGDSHYQKPWPRKLVTDPAVLKMKPAIEVIRRGRIPLILFPRVLKPFPIPLAAHFRRLVNALTITPIVVPTARTTAETVNHTLWKCFSLFLLVKCPLKVLLSHSQEHQSALNFLLTFLVLLLLKLVLHSHHWQSPDPPLRFLFVLGVMDSTFAFLDTFPYYTRDAPSCPDKTS